MENEIRDVDASTAQFKDRLRAMFELYNYAKSFKDAPLKERALLRVYKRKILNNIKKHLR